MAGAAPDCMPVDAAGACWAGDATPVLADAATVEVAGGWLVSDGATVDAAVGEPGWDAGALATGSLPVDAAGGTAGAGALATGDSDELQPAKMVSTTEISRSRRIGASSQKAEAPSTGVPLEGAYE